MNENKGGSLLVWLVTVILMLFSASRSVHLIQTTLPQDGQIMAYAALAALDGGVLGWFFFVTRTAAPGNQRTVGYLLLIVDLVGVVAAMLADTWLVAGQDEAMVGMVALWVLPIIIGTNIIGAYVAHLFDPAQALRDAEHAMQNELERQRARHIQENAAQYAAETAEAQAKHYVDETLARFRGAGSKSFVEEMLERLRGTGNGNGATKTTFASDAPALAQSSTDDAFEQARAVIEAAGGKVSRPKRP